MQLLFIVLFIGFVNLEIGNVFVFCLVCNQVVIDKRFDEFIFCLVLYESFLIMFCFYRMCLVFQIVWYNRVVFQIWSYMLDFCKFFCMFEYWGKCNDDVCLWQYVVDYMLDNVYFLLQFSKYLNFE